MKKEKHPTLGNMYRFATKEEEHKALQEIERIISPYQLSVEMLPDMIMSRGVQGDEGTYTRVVVLKGEYPSREILEEISTQITNLIPVNRVLFEIKKL